MPNVGNNMLIPGDYVLDSYALLAYFEAEPGSEQVRGLLEAAKEGKCRLYICVVNLGEVIYIVERERGLLKAQETLARIDEFPIEVVNVDRTLNLAAAHLKTDCPIAYADCFAAALAQIKNATLVTGDPEFQKIKADCNLRIEWLAEPKKQLWAIANTYSISAFIPIREMTIIGHNVWRSIHELNTRKIPYYLSGVKSYKDASF